jgi:hypothetical protein
MTARDEGGDMAHTMELALAEYAHEPALKHAKEEEAALAEYLLDRLAKYDDIQEGLWAVAVAVGLKYRMALSDFEPESQQNIERLVAMFAEAGLKLAGRSEPDA